MSSKVYEVPAEFAARARIRHDDYLRMYEESLRDPDGFWGRMGRRIDWMRPYTQVKDVSFDADDFRIRWYEDGQLNVAANCLDRHLATRGDKTAILWEGDDPSRVLARHLPRALPPGLQARQRAQGARRAEGRPRDDLPADDPGGGGGDARLRAHRRGPLGRVRRLLARLARRPHRRLRLEAS